MNISKNVDKVRRNIELVAADGRNVNIVAATKYVGVQQIKDLFACGITMMGENRVDALLEKKSQISLPIELSLIHI